MPSFNFKTTNKTVEYKVDDKRLILENRILDPEKDIYRKINKSKKPNIKNKLQELLSKKEQIIFIERSINNLLNYLNEQKYLPENLPEEINISFLKSQKFSILIPLEEKEIQDKNGLAAIKLGKEAPEIFLSLDLLTPRNRNYSNFLEMCKSTFADIKNPITGKKISFEEQQELVLETAFLHEFGHILSVLGHTNKNYFLIDTNQPLLDSFKRNYEEAFAEGFCVYVLQEKYPDEKFLPWLQAQRKNDAKGVISEGIYPYIIEQMYDLIQTKKNFLTIQDILTHIEDCAYRNVEKNVHTRIQDKDFLENLNKELSSCYQAQEASKITDKIKFDFASYSVPPTTALSGKVFKFREKTMKKSVRLTV